MSALEKALSDPWRISVCSDGFTSIRTGTRNDSPDADLNASVYEDEFAPMLLAAPDLLACGQFLADRIDEFERELLDDEPGRQFLGHVSPAVARFRAAIAKATQP